MTKDLRKVRERIKRFIRNVMVTRLKLTDGINKEINWQKINYKLRQLWSDTLSENNWPEGIKELWPLQYPELHTGRLLFIGLNPSYTGNKMVEIKNNNYLFNQTLYEKIIEAERVALGRNSKKKAYSYFLHFNEFVENTGLGWEHIDIFAVRERNQNKVKKALLSEENNRWEDFTSKQFDIFKTLLYMLDPVVIVVVNAFASRLLKKKMHDIISEFSNEDGYHFITIKEKQIPIFFSGMLTGQRALDIYSRERLIWHVKGYIKTKGRKHIPSSSTNFTK